VKRAHVIFFLTTTGGSRGAGHRAQGGSCPACHPAGAAHGKKVFDRVGVLRELLCVLYGYCSQTLLSMDKMDFIVQFLCLQ